MNYRETITAPANFDYTHKKQSGGSGQYGKVTGRIEPIEAAESGDSIRMEFNNHLVGTDVPSVFVPSIEKGFLEAMQAGNLTGHPVQVRIFVVLPKMIVFELHGILCEKHQCSFEFWGYNMAHIGPQDLLCTASLTHLYVGAQKILYQCLDS